ncbi:dihydroxy-acid dehydratase, partial [Amphritea sp.]|uniref:dihydroxy-acid dehydratase domain-containing protein n=1 Tax=Amphritea sp. TaxID=1872502 RepID=UPI003D09FFDB
DFTTEPKLIDGKLQWQGCVEESLDPAVLASAATPFDKEGGVRLLKGNLGRGVIKVSAVAPEHRVVKAPAVVLSSQHDLQAKFDAGELNRDCIVVIRHQGPKANGMPELHKLTPLLGVLQDRGYKVALVTDGRMSGASGKVPAAIHLSPEAAAGGLIGKVQDGDMVSL